jgi:hypothetical protein
MRIDGQLINAGTQVVDTLPTSDLFYGRTVLLSTDDTFYHYVGSAWTPIAASTLLELTDTPSDYTGHANKFLAVNSGENAIEFVNAPPGTTDELIKITQFDTTADYLNNKLVAGTDISVDVINEGANEQIRIAFSGSPGSTTFTGLTDTPNGYATFENQFVAVNSAGTQLEFVNAPGGSLPTPSAAGWFLMSDGSNQGDYNWYDNIKWLDGSIKLLNIGDYDTQGQYLVNGTPLSVFMGTRYEDKYIENLPINPSAGSLNILQTFSDLVIGNWYKVDVKFFSQWKSALSGTPKLSYDVKLMGATNTLRKVTYSEDMHTDSTSVQPWSFSGSFQATATSIALLLDVASDQIDISEGRVYALGMTVEEFNPEVRRVTTDW